jgi:hypothetical protein
MKVSYIKCMDFTFENAEIPDYHSSEELMNAIEQSKVIKVISEEGQLIDYVNSDYIMYFGIYE